MAIVNKTFRIFVSSTFSDLAEERNALQKIVFPKLRDLCMQHGYRFQAIDLRWGVREESALDQQTMNICLDEVARCQRPPNPNFIVLLGDRYGWQPLPVEIPVEEFKEIENRIQDNNDRKLVSEWYKRDDNAVPPVYCLQSRKVNIDSDDTAEQEKGERRKEGEEWALIENRIRDIFQTIVKRIPLSDQQKMKYVASATEQEIYSGALEMQNVDEHIFGFFREIEGLPQDESAEGFIDLINTDKNQVDEKAQSNLSELKRKLKAKTGDKNIFTYQVKWKGKGVSTNHLNKLCDDVYNSLAKIIKNEIGLLQEISPLQKEIQAHEDFRKDRAKHFVGRQEILKKIQDYLNGPDKHPLAIYGASGTGKSALMAKAIDRARNLYPDATVIFRFIGATPESSEVRSLLKNLCEQIYNTFDFEQQKNENLERITGDDEKAEKLREKILSEYSIPEALEQLPDTFHNFLNKIPPNKRLNLLIDSLDQLLESGGAANIKWIPIDLPKNVRLIVSTLPDERKNVLERNLPSHSLLELKPMPVSEGEQLLDLWLQSVRRTLQQPQREEILEKFNQNGLPLWLKLAFEESRKWKSYTNDVDLRPDTTGIIQDLFERLSLDENHGEMIVSRSLGYLVAAKNGLTEDELIDVLSQDNEIFNDFIKRSFHKPPEQRLPVVIWSRLYFDIEPYLIEKSADGTSLLAFYHRQFGEVIIEEYLSAEDKKKRHKGIAEYFGKQSLYIESETKKTPNLRKLSELPYHQTYGNVWKELYDTLTDTEFLEQKNTYFSVYELLEDYRIACEMIPQEGEAGKQRIVIQAFDQTLDRASFVLKENPELTFPQIYNHLQWQSDENILLKNKLEFEKNRFDRPWLWIISEPSESSGLIRTFTGHTESVDTCAFNPEDTRIVSGGFDKTLKIWDSETGKEICTLKGHFKKVNSCAFSPEGNHIVSASRDRTLRLWNAETGEEIFTLNGHKIAVYACAFSPDGKRIVSGGFDKTLKLWDTKTGKEISSLHGHTGSIEACSFSPDGKYILSGSRDKNLKLWDAETGKEIFTLKGHTNGVRGCAFSPDGNLIVSAGGILKLWNAKTGEEVFTLKNQKTDYVLTCAFSPDSRYIVSGGSNLTLWDANTGLEITTFKGHEGGVNDCTFSPDGKRIVSGGGDKTLKLWDVKTEKKISSPSGHTEVTGRFAFSPDGTRIVSGGSLDKTWNKSLRLWDVSNEKEISTLSGHTKSIISFAFSPDGKRIVTGSGDKTLKLWDATTGEEIYTLWGHTLPVQDCAFSPDGRRIVSASLDKTLKLWDTETGMEVFTFTGHSDFVRSCAFSPNGRYIASGSNDKTINLWDAETGMEIFTFRGHTDTVISHAFSPDGKNILSDSLDKTLKLWDAETGNEVFTLKYRHPHFSPDGRYIVTGSTDKTLKLWDAKTGREIFTLKGHKEKVTRYAFSPDGKFIVSYSTNKVIMLWDLATGRKISTLASHHGQLTERAFSPDGRHVILREGLEGKILYAYLENVERFIPIISAVKLYSFSEKTGKGIWGENFNSTCWWCGQSFQVSNEIVKAIQAIQPKSHISPFESPRLNPHQDVWQDIRLLFDCPNCHKPLRFNPFVVDSKRDEEPSSFQKSTGQKIDETIHSDADRHFRAGMDYWKLGDTDNAINEFKQTVHIDPDHIEAHYILGLAFWKKGLTESAINEWEIVIKTQNNHSEAHHHLGLAFSKLGINDKAQQYFKRALELGNKGTQEHINKLYKKRYDYSEKALKPLLKDAKKQIQLDPRRKAIQLNNIGVKNLKRGLKDQAVSYFKKAIQADPEFALPHINLGIEYINQDRFQDAISECNEAIKLEPNNAEASYYLGTAFARAKSLNKAKAAFEKTISLKNNHSKAHNSLGLVFAKQKNLEKAIYHFECAAKLGHKEAKNNLEKAIKMQEKSKGGLKSLFKRKPK